MDIRSAALIVLLASAAVATEDRVSNLPLNGALLEVPESLRRKPGDSDGIDQKIELHRNLTDVVKHLDESLEFYCDITGTPVPAYQWLKDEVPIPSNHDRIRTKVALYGAELTIDQLTEADSGRYTCIASNTAGIIRTVGLLTVTPTRRKKKHRKKRPKEGDSPGEGASESGGYCQTFKTTVCSSFLVGQDVYVPDNVYQYNMESQFVKLLQRMADVVNQTTCMQPLMEAVCRYKFPTCTQALPEPRRLCRQDCARVAWRDCQEDFEKLRASLEYFQENMRPEIDYLALLPDCSTLPSDMCASLRTVIPVPPSQRPPPPPPPPRPTQPTQEAAPPQPAADCYNGTGSSYLGTAARTRSGRVCLHWTFIPGYQSVGDHNWCRSPAPVPGLTGHKAPWCFVARSGAWEECDLQPCPLQRPGAALPAGREEIVTDGSSSSSGPRPPPGAGGGGGLVLTLRELLPICVSLGVLTLVALVLTVVCCVFRRSAAAEEASAASSQGGVGSGGGIGKAIKLSAKAKQSVSDLRLDMQCSAPLLAQEFPLSQIRFGEEIGESAFGKVYKGELIGVYTDTSLTPVAIKCLSAIADADLRAEFRAEMQRQAGLSHPSLLRLLGVSVRQAPCCLAMELLPHGDLRDFLAYRSPRCDHSGDYHDPLSHGQMLHIAAQLASAIDYLASRCLVHRDIAARNVLLGDNLQCKLSDLGQCRDAYSQDYYLVRAGSRLPIRWMPPEAILYGQFSSSSDVYSLGVLLWEIWSYGLQPYYGYSNSEVIDLVRQRQLLACPPECPARVYALMLDCWAQLPGQRLGAGSAHDRLRQWQSELLVELSTSSQGSGHTNSTSFSTDPRLPVSQRVIPVPVPQMSPPESGSAGSFSSGGGVCYGGQLQGLGYQHPRLGPSLHVPAPSGKSGLHATAAV